MDRKLKSCYVRPALAVVRSGAKWSSITDVVKSNACIVISDTLEVYEALCLKLWFCTLQMGENSSVGPRTPETSKRLAKSLLTFTIKGKHNDRSAYILAIYDWVAECHVMSCKNRNTYKSALQNRPLRPYRRDITSYVECNIRPKH